MARALYTLVITFLAICQYSFGQRADTIHTEWVNNDINIVKALASINKNDPAAMEAFFLQFDDSKQRDTLGFGWSVLTHGKGAGYIGVYADFYHYKDKIISYRLYSRAPSRKELKEQYRTMFANLLPIDSNGFYYYEFNEGAILKPLLNYGSAPGKHIPTNHLALMSPATGTMYGIC